MQLIRPSSFPFPLHSVTVLHGDTLLQDDRFGVCAAGGPHRMFSISKSFTSLAIGALAAEGRLSLRDTIASFFPEYMPEQPHPWLTQMTIEDLLTMRTCYKSTTYKLDMRAHWVASFFRTPPDHRPGQLFRYDTSASHTLAALVRKLTGQTVLDYLRTLYLDAIGFSREAYFLTDPFGCELGGSGLVCTPEDLLKTAVFLRSLYNGTWDRTAFPDHAFMERYAEYVRSAMSYHVSTVQEGKTLDECMGYGYMFWRIRDGVMMYGMGGQYVVFYPEQDLLFVTTADTQAVQGGGQLLLDAIRSAAVSVCGEEAFRSGGADAGAEVSGAAGASDAGAAVCGASVDPSLYGTYRLAPNAAGFTGLSIDDTALRIDAEQTSYSFLYGRNTPVRSVDPLYRQPLFGQAYPQPDGSLYLYVQIVGDYVGSLHFLLRASDGCITLSIRRFEETLFPAFDGFFEGTRA